MLYFSNPQALASELQRLSQEKLDINSKCENLSNQIDTLTKKINDNTQEIIQLEELINLNAHQISSTDRQLNIEMKNILMNRRSLNLLTRERFIGDVNNLVLYCLELEEKYNRLSLLQQELSTIPRDDTVNSSIRNHHPNHFWVIADTDKKFTISNPSNLNINYIKKNGVIIPVATYERNGTCFNLEYITENTLSERKVRNTKKKCKNQSKQWDQSKNNFHDINNNSVNQMTFNVADLVSESKDSSSRVLPSLSLNDDMPVSSKKRTIPQKNKSRKKSKPEITQPSSPPLFLSPEKERNISPDSPLQISDLPCISSFSGSLFFPDEKEEGANIPLFNLSPPASPK